MAIRSRAVWLGAVAAAGLSLLLIIGCSQSGDDAAEGASDVGTVDAQPGSSELLERAYGYLVREDKDFTRLAPNYSTLRPFNPDSAIVVETRSQAEGIESPAADFQEYLHIRINRAMPVRVVIADSTGTGLIVYDLKGLTEGAYTVGSKGWPVPQVELTKEQNWIYIYVVGDTRFRWRERFRLDEKRNLVPLAPSPVSG